MVVGELSDDVHIFMPARVRFSQIQKCFTELRDKALQRIQEEDINKDFLWACPNCGEDTFVIEDSKDICFLCRYSEKTVECPNCSNIWFEDEMEPFSDLIETDYCDGSTHILNDYGYSFYEACPDCIGEILEDIETQRAEDHYRYMEEEE